MMCLPPGVMDTKRVVGWPIRAVAGPTETPLRHCRSLQTDFRGRKTKAAKVHGIDVTDLYMRAGIDVTDIYEGGHRRHRSI